MNVQIAEWEAGVENEFTDFIKFLLWALTILKTLHFVSTFEELGFFMDLLVSSIAKLSTFLVSYIMFGVFFVVMYVVIGNEPGEAFDTSVGLGTFGKLYLFVWGNGACTFGLMNYPHLWQQETNN